MTSIVPSTTARRPTSRSRRPASSAELQALINDSLNVPVGSKPAMIRAVELFGPDAQLLSDLTELYKSVQDDGNFHEAYAAFVKRANPVTLRLLYCSWIDSHARNGTAAILRELVDDLILSGKILTYMDEIERGVITVDELAKRYEKSAWVLSCEHLRAAVRARDERLTPAPLIVKGHSYRERRVSGQANL